jgi:hypothetical protein
MNLGIIYDNHIKLLTIKILSIMYQNVRQPIANTCMPLIMRYTPSTRIQEEQDEQFVYDDRKQIPAYDMRTVGTSSLKTSSTKKPNGGTKAGDRKNAIDDLKHVK